MKNNKTVAYVHRSKTRDGYPARMILLKYKGMISIESRLLIPISELSPFIPYVELRRFKDRALISTSLGLRAETWKGLIEFIEGKGWI
jgi:hypothetical protein